MLARKWINWLVFSDCKLKPCFLENKHYKAACSALNFLHLIFFIEKIDKGIITSTRPHLCMWILIYAWVAHTHMAYTHLGQNGRLCYGKFKGKSLYPEITIERLKPEHWNICLSMIIQQWVIILEWLQHHLVVKSGSYRSRANII